MCGCHVDGLESLVLRMQATLLGGRVFVFGGEDASRRPLGELHVLDPAACSWQPVTTTGLPPSPRRRALLTMHTVVPAACAPLHGKLCRWVAPLRRAHYVSQTAAVYGKRGGGSAHTAVAFRDRFLLVFAGGSMAACFSDLHALDTHTMTWSQPPVTGATPSPRAGAAGCAGLGMLSGCVAACEQSRCELCVWTCRDVPCGC